MRFVQVVVLLWSAVMISGSRRILVVFPLPGPSHSIAGQSLVDILLDEGHEVTYMTAFPRQSNNPRLTYVNVSSVVQDFPLGEKPNVEKLARNPRPPHRILEIGPTLNKRGLLHPSMQDLLLDTSTGFDLVIAEWFYSGLLAPLAAVYECPLIWYSASDVSWQTLRLMHEATSPTYTVELNSRAAPAVPFTIKERAHQLWLQIYLGAWTYYVKHTIELPTYGEIYRKPFQLRGRRLPDYDELVYNGSLMLVNSHPPLGQRVPLPQNVKYVGGHHVEVPTKPLPENLQKILDNTKNGAIFFSMGSNLKSADFPEHMKRELVQMLGQLEQTVLWKFEEKLENLPSNLHILDWAPQASILSHPNTILFISHGGLHSQIEAMHYGVPVVGIPLFGDQFVNIDLAAARGFAIRVDFSEDLPVKIKEAVNEILGNFSYRRNAKQASAQFHNRLASPQREVAHWVKVVLETKGAPHLRSPALSVPAADRLYLDLIVVLLLVMWFMSKVLKVIKVHWTAEVETHDKKTL